MQGNSSRKFVNALRGRVRKNREPLGVSMEVHHPARSLGAFWSEAPLGMHHRVRHRLQCASWMLDPLSCVAPPSHNLQGISCDSYWVAKSFYSQFWSNYASRIVGQAWLECESGALSATLLSSTACHLSPACTCQPVTASSCTTWKEYRISIFRFVGYYMSLIPGPSPKTRVFLSRDAAVRPLRNQLRKPVSLSFLEVIAVQG